MTIPTLPTPPTRADSVNFATRGDDFMAALPTVATEMNNTAAVINGQYNAIQAAYGVAGSLGTLASSAAASAASASAAKDLALAAWGASMAPAETLPSISKSIHSGAIVKSIIYDTAKDSDGGAWRKRCADKSWYTEALGFTGTWGGQAAGVAAGWAACGSVTGGAYQSTVDGKFYTPTSVSTQTEIFRGNVREFPEQVAIVAETGRVVIYDLTQTGTPMWMVFYRPTSNEYVIRNGSSCSSLASANGLIVIGQSDAAALVSFIADDCSFRHSGGWYKRSVPSIQNRNSVAVITATTGAIVNATVNDVALTVLDTAPIDTATGLPVPTIAVATAGGVSVIKDDGTVVNSTPTGNMKAVVIQNGYLYYGYQAGTAYGFYVVQILGISAAFSGTFYTPTSVPSLPSSMFPAGAGKYIAYKSELSPQAGLGLLKENPATPAKGMVSYITNAYNTGWMPGDIRGAYLADTTAETITGSGELVTNGTFTTDTAGWTDATSTDGTPSWSAGKLRITRDTVNTQCGMYQAFTTVAGKSYVVSFDYSSTCAVFLYVSSTSGNTGDLYGTGSMAAGTSTKTATFTATGATTYVSVWAHTGAAGTTADFDNISVKLAEPDRSVKNTGLVLNGSLTKTAVASGAGLVAYSGFSAANYLEQPYNANLDFGTGDFCVMGWVIATVTARLYARGIVAGASCMAIDVVPSTGIVNIYKSSGFWMATPAAAFTSGQTFLLCVSRTSGTVTIAINGVVVATATSDTTSLTLSNAIARLGVAVDGTTPLTSGSMALWRISATAPSADQIAHIYRTELPLFQANAQCTLAGTSAAVTALAYDDVADTLHVGTSWGRSAFRDLMRVDSEATSTGAITALSANQGAVLTGGASSGRFYQPAMLLRDELRRKDEARKALGKTPVFFDYTATASQTAFVLPKGYTAKALYKNGTLMREATTGTYWIRSNDGFAETATLSVGASVSDWISIMATRNY